MAETLTRRSKELVRGLRAVEVRVLAFWLLAALSRVFLGLNGRGRQDAADGPTVREAHIWPLIPQSREKTPALRSNEASF
jgi:hypothetical protein